MSYMTSKKYNFSTLLLFIFSSSQSHGLIVNLTSGPIQGRLQDVNGQKVQVFKGVPYAAKPIGNLRFQNAQPTEPWNTTVITTEYSPACLSNSSQTTSPQYYISEDCLYLNIWADLRCKNNPCPVVFYLHGGGFHFDSATMFNETEIMAKFGSHRIVFVIPAFRLGLFGAMDLGRELDDAPYNVGLNDIVFALKWVRKEISKFGGDPKKVTLFGNSGGASSLSLLLVSPALTTDLFSQAWIASGLPLMEPHLNINTTDVIATQAGCPKTPDIRKRLECLRGLPAERINNAARETELTFWENIGVQTDVHTVPGNSFADLIDRWKPVPIVFSVTVRELVFNLKSLEYMCSAYPKMFGYTSYDVVDECVTRYQNNSEKISPEIMHAVAYYQAKVNVLRSAPTYFLVWGQKDHDKHANELAYFFGLHPVLNKTEDDWKMEKFFPQVCRNYFNEKKPLEDWDQVDYNGRNYYYFNFSGQETPHMVKGGVYDVEALKFWLYHLKDVEDRATRRQRSINKVNIIQRNALEQSGSSSGNSARSGVKKYQEMESSSVPLLTVLTILIIAAFVLATIAFTLSVIQMCLSWRKRRVQPQYEEEEMKVLRRHDEDYPRYVF